MEEDEGQTSRSATLCAQKQVAYTQVEGWGKQIGESDRQADTHASQDAEKECANGKLRIRLKLHDLALDD